MAKDQSKFSLLLDIDEFLPLKLTVNLMTSNVLEEDSKKLIKKVVSSYIYLIKNVIIF